MKKETLIVLQKKLEHLQSPVIQNLAFDIGQIISKLDDKRYSEAQINQELTKLKTDIANIINELITIKSVIQPFKRGK